jgi:16S rRNA (guanine966-N2)-methyltransferase
MTLRVTAGIFKGIKLNSPKELARPTSSKMREALFNIIAQNIQDANFLDLFAGSGIMGIEALSRGAKNVVFVEKNKQNALNIEKNLAKLKKPAKIINQDVLLAIELLNLKFDIVFLDPPYKISHLVIPKTLNLLDLANILTSKAKIFIETSHEYSFELIAIKNFQHLKSKKYGNSALHQFQYSSK